MYADLKQYTSNETIVTGSGAMLKAFYMHISNNAYRTFIEDLLDGFLGNLDEIENYEDIFTTTQIDVHMYELANDKECYPYDDPLLLDFIMDCVDPNAKVKRYSRSIVEMLYNFVLHADNTEVGIEIKSNLLNIYFDDDKKEEYEKKLQETPVDDWHEINKDISVDNYDYVDLFLINPTKEKQLLVKEIMQLGDFMKQTQDTWWNLIYNYCGGECCEFDYDHSEMASLIEKGSTFTIENYDHKYDVVFEAFDTHENNYELIKRIERCLCSRKEVLF